MFSSNPVRTLRFIGLIEAISYILLLFIAVPLKHLYGYPEAVRWLGMIHGVLFIAFVISLMYAGQRANWNLKRKSLIFIASIIPFATFLIDSRMKRYASEFKSDQNSQNSETLPA